MNPTATKAMDARFLTDRVTVRRTRSSVNTDATNVRARIKGYAPTDIGGTILQGDQLVILHKPDMDLQDWPVPPQRGDRIIVGGRLLTVESVDQNTRKVGETIIAYEIQVRG